MKLVYLPVILLLLAFSKEPNQRFTDKEYPYVDKLMKEFLQKTKVAGVALTVKQGDEIIYSQGFGYADVKQKIKMESSSQIRTASVAKVLTATALGKLATEGKLDFDAPIKEYIPNLKEPYASLSIRQIAGHTAGIPHRPSSKKVSNKPYPEVRESLAFVLEEPLLFKPGTDYAYSSLGYNVLAAIIEKTSGKRYVDYMKEDIFTPLGMGQTFPDNPSEFTPKDAKLYYVDQGKLKLDQKIQDGSYKLAGAGFRSTSVDLVKLMNAYSHGFIAPEIVQDMFTSQTLKNGQSTQVGIAWRLNQDANHNTIIEHAGSWQGARTVIVYYPENQLSLSMMINTKCALFIEETAHILAQFFLPGQSQAQKALAGLEKTVEIKNNRSDGSTETYPGKLTFTGEKTGELSMETDRDWLKTNPVYHISAENNFALATPYGLMYLHITFGPQLEGKVFQYQFLNDPYHVNQKPMIYFQGTN